MAGEFQNLGVALKTVYPDKAIEPMLNEEAPFRKKMSGSVPAGGRVSEGIVTFNGYLDAPQNVAQIVDGDDLQDATERSEVQFTLRPTIFTATMNVGWLTRKAANTGKSAFNGGEARRRTEETIGNAGKFIESTYVGTSNNGVRAVVESSSASGIVLRLPEGGKLLRPRMKITVRDGANFATIRATLDALRVQSFNPDTRRITLPGPPTYTNAVANDVIFVVTKASFTVTGGVYANGLRGLVDDGTNSQFIHGVDRTTVGNEKLKSYVNSAGGGPLRNLTEQILIRTCNSIRETSGKRPTDLWLGPGQIEKYIEFVAPERRRAVESGSYDKSTGWKDGEIVHYAPGVALRFNLSFDIIPREAYVLTWDSFFHYVAQAMQWMDDDSMLHLAIGTSGYKARWDSFMAGFENIGCDMPCSNGVLRDLKDPAIGDV